MVFTDYSLQPLALWITAVITLIGTFITKAAPNVIQNYLNYVLRILHIKHLMLLENLPSPRILITISIITYKSSIFCIIRFSAHGEAYTNFSIPFLTCIYLPRFSIFALNPFHCFFDVKTRVTFDFTFATITAP